MFYKPQWVNSLWPSDNIEDMVTKIHINTGSGNGLLLDSTKPLPEPMLTHNHRSPLGLHLKANFIGKSLRYIQQNFIWKSHFKIFTIFPRGQWVNWAESLLRFTGIGCVIWRTGVAGRWVYGIRWLFFNGHRSSRRRLLGSLKGFACLLGTAEHNDLLKNTQQTLPSTVIEVEFYRGTL